MAEATTTATDSTIGVYATSDAALSAAKALKDAGFGDDVVSVVGKGVKDDEKVHAWVPRGNQAGTYGGWGALWGALTGWLLLGFVWLPGIGWVAAAGWLASTLVGAGLGAGLGALIGLAVPEDEIPVYEDELRADRYLVIVHGDADTVDRAHTILEAADAISVKRYGK